MPGARYIAHNAISQLARISGPEVSRLFRELTNGKVPDRFSLLMGGKVKESERVVLEPGKGSSTTLHVALRVACKYHQKGV